MNIDFIKWKVEYAEGFEWMEYATDDIEVHVPWRLNGEPFTDFDSEEWKKLYNPLLLQRAIEGVNRLHGLLEIQHNVNDIQIFNRETINIIYFMLNTYDSIDQAKDAALEYGYKQESINE